MIYEEKLAYRLTWTFDDPNPKESFSEFKERIIKAKREKHKIDEECNNYSCLCKCLKDILDRETEY